jgi:predicted methyltransferase
MPRIGRIASVSRLVVFAVGLALVAGAWAQEKAARDQWQRPQEVLDGLGLKAGSMVADVGAGGGYFTWHMARRVGAQGRVYPVDIKPETVERLRERAKSQGFPQVEPVLGDLKDPHLPAGKLDAALVVNAYHDFDEPAAMLRGIFAALRSGGRFGVVDKESQPASRAEYHSKHRIPKELVRQEAEQEGFRFVEERPGFRRTDDNTDWYYLVFAKP